LIVPTVSARRYTQVQPSQKSRHFGMDAEIQTMPVLSEAEGDGNLTLCKWLIHGINPSVHIRVTGFALSQAPAWECGL